MYYDSVVDIILISSHLDNIDNFFTLPSSSLNRDTLLLGNNYKFSSSISCNPSQCGFAIKIQDTDFGFAGMNKSISN